MKAIFLALWLIALQATELSASEESTWFFETGWTHYGSNDESLRQSLNGKEFLAITPTTASGFGAYVFAYHDETVYNYFVGPTYEIENEQVGYFQVGGGVGETHFEDYDDFFTLNFWLYWDRQGWLTSLYSEYIPEEADSAEWFWRTELHKKFGKANRHFIGLYGERWLGYGPMIGYVVNDHITIKITRPHHSDYEYFGAISFTF